MSLLSEDKDQLIRLILNWATEELPSPLLPPLDLPCSFFFEPQNANFDVILDRETEEFSSHLFKSVQEFISKYLPSFNEINTTIQSYEELTIQTKNNEQPQHQPQQQQQQQHTTNDENLLNRRVSVCSEQRVTMNDVEVSQSQEQHHTQEDRLTSFERILRQQQEAIQYLQQMLQTRTSLSPPPPPSPPPSPSPPSSSPPSFSPSRLLSRELSFSPSSRPPIETSSSVAVPTLSHISTSRSTSLVSFNPLLSSDMVSTNRTAKSDRVHCRLMKCLQRADAPRFSSLTFAEHTQFLRLQKLLTLSTNQYTTHPAFSLWKKLVDRVHCEQELFRQHEFSLAQTSPQRERFLSYPISVRTLVEKILDMRKQYVYHYPRFYRLVNSISLDHRSIVSTSLSTSKLTLQHLRTLLKKGKCYLFDCNALPTGTRIPMNLNYYPSPHEVCVGRWWSKRPVPVVSMDPTIEHFVHNEAIDIVLSSSSITALFSLILLKEGTCDMPATIRNISGRSVLYIDTPFIKKTYTPREKNTIFYTLAIKHLGLNASKVECSKSFTSTATTTTAATNTSQDPSLKSEEVTVGPDNLTYNLWQLGPFHILVRCHLHGMIPDGPGWKYINIISKLEYWEESIETGGSRAEMITLEERARQWIKGFIRPGPASTLFAHIDPIAQTLRRFTLVENQSLLPFSNDDELKESSFSPAVAFKAMYSIFEKLRTLPADYTYIISYEAKSKTLYIYQSTKENSPESQTTKESKNEESLQLGIAENGSSLPLLDRQCSQTTSIKNFPQQQQQQENFETNSVERSTLDLHQAYVAAGVTDLRTIHYIPLKWPSNRANQIPYTFSPLPEIDNETGNLKYCFSFAQTATCTAGSECPFPHLTHSEVVFCQQATAKEKRRKKKKAKSKRKKNKNFQTSLSASSNGQGN